MIWWDRITGVLWWVLMFGAPLLLVYAMVFGDSGDPGAVRQSVEVARWGR